MGYDKAEVNKFVNEVTSEYEKMLNKLKQKDADIESLKNELVKYQNLESTLNKTILVAEEVSNNMRSESKSILDEARKNASRILNDALIKAEKAQNDADMLKRRVINFKRRFRQAVENELDIIDSIEEDY